MTATRSGLDLVIHVDDSESCGNNVAPKRSPQLAASSPVGWSCKRTTSNSGPLGSRVSEDTGKLGSRTSLNSGVPSSTASLDVHAPSLPTLDSFRGRQNSFIDPTGLAGGDILSFSCPCLATISGETQQKFPGPTVFPRASSIFDMQHTAPSTGEAGRGATGGGLTAIAVVKGNLLSLPSAISPFALRRRANYRRKCEDWLDHIT